MKRTLPLLLLFVAVSLYGQKTPASASIDGSCGPDQVRFDVENQVTRPNLRIEPGKALIVVSEVFKKAPGELGNPTLRLGLDADWVGAVRGNSYFSFSVEPGEHHPCAKWQSHFKRLSREAAFIVFNAEAGKIYYFRARINYDLGPEYGRSGNIAGMSVTLDAISSDEGKYLIASNPMSVPHPKK